MQKPQYLLNHYKELRNAEAHYEVLAGCGSIGIQKVLHGGAIRSLQMIMKVLLRG